MAGPHFGEFDADEGEYPDVISSDAGKGVGAIHVVI